MTETNSPEPSPDDARVVLVTGVSGAGKSTALKALEDLGYEAVDNVPLPLMRRLVSPGADAGPLAIGVDIRTRNFDAGAFLAEVGGLSAQRHLDVQLVFVDCTDDILVHRFEETRRRHPLATDRPVSDGIREERALMAPLRASASLVIDTSEMTSGELKPLLASHFALAGEPGLMTFIKSFGFKNGLPRDADLVFDVRFLRNPHYDEALRLQTGRDRAVADFVEMDPDFASFFDNLTGLIAPLLPRYQAEGKSYLTIAIGCTGGRHRSVLIAERLAAWLAAAGHRLDLRHRDLPGPTEVTAEVGSDQGLENPLK